MEKEQRIRRLERTIISSLKDIPVEEDEILKEMEKPTWRELSGQNKFPESDDDFVNKIQKGGTKT